MDREIVKPKMTLVSIDQTKYWDLSEYPEVKKIKAIYLVDKSQHHFLCELTASLWLEYVATDIVYKNLDEVSNERLERIDYEVNRFQETGGEYHHVKSIKNSEKMEVIPIVDATDVLEWRKEFETYEEFFEDYYESLRESGDYWV